LDGTSQQALLGNNEEIESTKSEYSTTVIRSHSPQASTPIQPSLSSILTIRTPQPTDADTMRMPAAASIMSIDSFHTASSSISIAAATEGSSITDGTSTIKAGSTPKTFIHRFTLIKPGARRQTPGGARTPGSPVKGATTSENGGEPSSPGSDGQIWSPFGFFFSSALAAKCDMCGKRLGFKPVLECDDCGLRTHIKCGEVAPMDCGIRPARPRVPQTFLPGSPLSKAKQVANRSAANSPAASPRRF